MHFAQWSSYSVVSFQGKLQWENGRVPQKMLLSFGPIWFRRAFPRSRQEAKATWGLCIFLFKSIANPPLVLFAKLMIVLLLIVCMHFPLNYVSFNPYLLIILGSLFIYISFSDGVSFSQNGIAKKCGFLFVSILLNL